MKSKNITGSVSNTKVWAVTMDQNGVLYALEYHAPKNKSVSRFKMKLNPGLDEGDIKEIVESILDEDAEYFMVPYQSIGRSGSNTVIGANENDEHDIDTYTDSDSDPDTDSDSDSDSDTERSNSKASSSVPPPSSSKKSLRRYNNNNSNNNNNNTTDVYTELESAARNRTTIPEHVFIDNILPYVNLHNNDKNDENKKYSRKRYDKTNRDAISSLYGSSKGITEAAIPKYAQQVFADAENIAIALVYRASSESRRKSLDRKYYEDMNINNNYNIKKYDIIKALRVGGVDYPSYVLDNPKFFEELLRYSYSWATTMRIIDGSDIYEPIIEHALSLTNDNQDLMKYVALYRNGKYIPKMSDRLRKSREFINMVIDLSGTTLFTIKPMYIDRELYEYPEILRHMTSLSQFHDEQNYRYLRNLHIPMLTSLMIDTMRVHNNTKLVIEKVLLAGEIPFTDDELLQILRSHGGEWYEYLMDNPKVLKETKDKMKSPRFIFRAIRANPAIIRNVDKSNVPLEAWALLYNIPWYRNKIIPRDILLTISDPITGRLKPEYEM